MGGDLPADKGSLTLNGKRSTKAPFGPIGVRAMACVVFLIKSIWISHIISTEVGQNFSRSFDFYNKINCPDISFPSS